MIQRIFPSHLSLQFYVSRSIFPGRTIRVLYRSLFPLDINSLWSNAQTVFGQQSVRVQHWGLIWWNGKGYGFSCYRVRAIIMWLFVNSWKQKSAKRGVVVRCVTIRPTVHVQIHRVSPLENKHGAPRHLLVLRCWPARAGYNPIVILEEMDV